MKVPLADLRAQYLELKDPIDAGMAIDRRLNAIWLRGSPDYIARMKQMIATIDVPLDSVVLETQFVELTESGARAIGIDFNNANGQIGLVTFHSGEASLPGITGTAPALALWDRKAITRSRGSLPTESESRWFLRIRIAATAMSGSWTWQPAR